MIKIYSQTTIYLYGIFKDGDMLHMIELVAKIVGYGIDIFVGMKGSRDKLRSQFLAFFKESGNESLKSAKLKRDLKKIKKDFKDLDKINNK